MSKIIQQLTAKARTLGTTVIFVESLDGGYVAGICDYAERKIVIATQAINDHDKLSKLSNDEITFTLAHELSHLERFEDCEDDDMKLARATEIVHGKSLHSRKDLTKARKLSSLSLLYAHELDVDWQAQETLERLGAWNDRMLQYIENTHLLMYRYRQIIDLGSCSTASARRMRLVFKDLYSHKFDPKVLKQMTAFMSKYPQYCEEERND